MKLRFIGPNADNRWAAIFNNLLAPSDYLFRIILQEMITVRRFVQF